MLDGRISVQVGSLLVAYLVCLIGRFMLGIEQITRVENTSPPYRHSAVCRSGNMPSHRLPM